MTTLTEARRLLEVTERAKRTHRVAHVEADKVGPVLDGVTLPDTPAFYVVRKRLSVPTGEGERRQTEWVVVHAATTQGGAVDWVDADRPRDDE